MSGLFTARTPIHEIADVERLRLRAMGRLDLLMIEALGASGVQVAWEEVPQALQTGIAQGYFNPPLAPVLTLTRPKLRSFRRRQRGLPNEGPPKGYRG